MGEICSYRKDKGRDYSTAVEHMPYIYEILGLIFGIDGRRKEGREKKEKGLARKKGWRKGKKLEGRIGRGKGGEKTLEEWVIL